MARDTEREGSLSANIQVSGGLQQFRSVAQGGGRDGRDSPFGAPLKPVVTEPVPVVPAPQLEPVRVRPQPVVKAPKETKPQEAEERNEEVLPVSTFGENVTVPLSQALRDRSEELSRAINRNRSVRKHRITRNSIIRVALQCFLDEFEPDSNRPINSEDELLQAAKRRRKK